jgi:hypothetical protein
MLTYTALVWWKKTHLTTVEKLVWSYLADYLLGYDKLYEHHTYDSNEYPPGATTRQTAYRLHCSIFKMATEDFPVLLAPSESILPLEVLDRKYLVEYIISLY